MNNKKRIGVITGIILIVIVIGAVGYLLIFPRLADNGQAHPGTDSSQDESKQNEDCQKVVDSFKDRGPLEELTAEDARCMELLR